MRLKDLNGLFLHELRDLYSAERQLVKALPKMAKAATSEELRQSFEEHLVETEMQIKRLEEVFEELDASPRGPKCAGMEGLIEEAKALLEEDADPRVLDAALICAAQRVEHYEIAGYGCVRSLAQQLGMNQLAEELQETLNEEKKTNEKLNELALGDINEEAMTSAGDGSTASE
ncbi:MAG: YciE/YciF ferroxidase family protein [Thermoguttaceae bacterium]